MAWRVLFETEKEKRKRTVNFFLMSTKHTSFRENEDTNKSKPKEILLNFVFIKAPDSDTIAASFVII